MDATDSGQGIDGSSTAAKAESGSGGMQETCSELGGWFPRVTWETACEASSRLFCDLLPVSLLGRDTEPGEKQSEGTDKPFRSLGARLAAHARAQAQAQAQDQGDSRLGSLPTQTQAAAAAGAAPREGGSAAAAGASGGGASTSRAGQNEADTAGLQSQDAHDLLPPEPSTSAAPARDTQGASEGGKEKGQQPDNWHDAFRQITDQLRQACLYFPASPSYVCACTEFYRPVPVVLVNPSG